VEKDGLGVAEFGYVRNWVEGANFVLGVDYCNEDSCGGDCGYYFGGGYLAGGGGLDYC